MRTRHPERPGAHEPERHSKAPSAATELLYGRNAVRESLRAGRREIRRLLVSASAGDHPRMVEIVALATRRGIPVESVAREQLDALVAGRHQGVVLEASPYPYATRADVRDLARDRAILLALDGLEDPQNVGTLLRTAEATGVELVVIPTDRAAGMTPAVVNASSGAIEHLRIVREVNLTRWLRLAQSSGFWVVGLDNGADTQPLFSTDMTAPLVVVIGSEGSGLRRLVRESCDLLVAIPMAGQVESLNAAVAGSLALYEALRDAGAA